MITDNSTMTKDEAEQLAEALRERTGNAPFSVTEDGKGILFSPWDSPSTALCPVALTDDGNEQWQGEEGEEDSEPWDFAVEASFFEKYGEDARIFAILSALLPS